MMQKDNANVQPQSADLEYFVIVAGVKMAISNPKFGCGPSSAPTCPNAATHVWLDGTWHRVYNTQSSSSPPVRAGPLPPPVPSARHQGTDNHGYQVLVWGPNRQRTSLSQVMLTAKDVLESAREGLPADLLVGRKQWLGQYALKCDLSSTVVKRLTAGVVASIKYALNRKLQWRAVFLYDRNTILCTPEAYEALDSDPRRRQIYYTHPVLSNQFAALEPAAEWYQDVMLDSFDSDEDASSQADSDSDDSEWEEVLQPELQQQQPGPTTLADVPLAQQQQQEQQAPPLQQQRQRPRRHARPSRAPVQPTRGLNVGVINATGLTHNGTKRLELTELLLESQVDIMGVTETHESHDRRLPADHIPGYKFYSKPRPVGRGGGVAVAVHACLTHEIKPFAFTDQQYDEAIWLVLQRRGQVRKMFIGVVYMPDMSKSASVREAAYTQLQQDMLHLSSQGSVVVVGDFNARVGRAAQPNTHIGMHGESNDDVNGNGNLLISMLNSVDMYALNARTPPPTPDAHLTYMKHRANGEVMGKSLIDYIITTPDVAMPRGVAAGPTATVGRKLVSTDHVPVFANIQRVLVRRTACEKFRLKLNATSKDFVSKGGEPSPALEAYLASVQAVESAYSNFVSALQSGHAASQVSATSAVQQAHEALIGAIRHAVNASFGYKHVATGRCVPWWSQDLTDAIQDRTKAFEAFRESCLAQDWHIYQSKRKAAHKLVAAAKHAHQQKLSAAVTQAYHDRINDDSVLGERDMWQYLRNICP
eukprot:gene4854-biopygen6608